MNKYLKNLIESKAVVAGRVIIDNGFIIFQREDDLENIENIPEEELGFATTAMGRAIFKVSKDGKIINYKGVDSHLDNTEASLMNLVSVEAACIPNLNKSYKDSIYPMNLVVFYGKRPDIRIRGASPFEDLEIEADINSRMQGNGIKLPTIREVKEFSEEFALKYGLPIKVEGNFGEFDSDCQQEDSERKSRLRDNPNLKYDEVVIPGKRPETLGEYFKRTNIYTRLEFIDFAENNGFKIEDFIEYVDKTYSLGQRYGQTERHLENPFRISDIEYYTKVGDIETLENIISFSESVQSSNEPMENFFAKQMGKNIANMLNSGWMCENFSHRQDYTLAGEMCDDSYFFLPDRLKQVESYSDGKRQAIKKDLKSKYFYQIYALSSTIKVLEDEMSLRGKSEEEIQSVFDDFINEFSENLNLQQITNVVGVDANLAFEILVKKPTNYKNKLAEKVRREGIVYDDEILHSHEGNNAFFNKVSMGIANSLGIEISFYTPQQDDGLNLE